MSNNNEEPNVGCIFWMLGFAVLLCIVGVVMIIVVPELRDGWNELVSIFKSMF